MEIALKPKTRLMDYICSVNNLEGCAETYRKILKSLRNSQVVKKFNNHGFTIGLFNFANIDLSKEISYESAVADSYDLEEYLEENFNLCKFEIGSVVAFKPNYGIVNKNLRGYVLANQEISLSGVYEYNSKGKSPMLYKLGFTEKPLFTTIEDFLKINPNYTPEYYTLKHQFS